MIILTITTIIILSATIQRRDFTIWLSRITLTSLLLIFYTNYSSTWFTYLEKGLTLYNGVFQCNSNTHIFNSFITILGFFILTITSYYPRKLSIINNDNYILGNKVNNDENTRKHVDSNFENIKKENNDQKIDISSSQFKILEYSLLILFILCGAIFLMSSNDIISIFISIELQSYGLYLLSSVYRNSESSTKAGLTYFLLGGLSSCIILLSQGILYINSGITNIENIYILCNINIMNPQSINIDNIEELYTLYYTNISLAILSVGLLFKVSAAPFHFWSPDVYDGVPTIVTTFIAIIAKISIFIFLLELVHFTNNTYSDLLSYGWTRNLLISSLLSLLIGTVLGLTQFRIKRLYAYSTISHVGFILLALSINTTESIQAFIFYLIQYSISNLNAFIILLSVGYLFINYFNNNKENSEVKERENSPIQLTSQLKGLYEINPVMALSFGITLFSFLGVPPLLGFFGKQMVLSASLDNGYIFMSLVAILTSVISAVYYLVVIKQIFFDKNEKSVANMQIVSKDTIYVNGTNYINLSSNLTAIISILTLITFIYMFVPTEMLNLVKILSLFICNV